MKLASIFPHEPHRGRQVMRQEIAIDQFDELMH
jgi:hypothetical protein